MLTAANALWCSSSPPGVSSQLDWLLTSMPYLGFSPVYTSWHWMPLSTAGEWCFCGTFVSFLWWRQKVQPCYQVVTVGSYVCLGK